MRQCGQDTSFEEPGVEHTAPPNAASVDLLGPDRSNADRQRLICFLDPLGLELGWGESDVRAGCKIEGRTPNQHSN